LLLQGISKPGSACLGRFARFASGPAAVVEGALLVTPRSTLGRVDLAVAVGLGQGGERRNRPWSPRAGSSGAPADSLRRAGTASSLRRRSAKLRRHSR